MDKKSKDALRRYKKSRQQTQSSSDSSSSSDSDSGSSSSYSSSSSGRKAAERHRKKKARQAAVAVRRSSSSSGDERRKREKREHACQKKLEAKRNHLKRKLKEAKLKKRAAAAAAAALSGHSHRSLSPATQAKLKKLAERKHQRAASKERREREREKHRAAARGEREQYVRESRSPTKITKIRIHQDVKQRQKSPTRVHHQLMSREKIIIQARTRDRTPSAERQRHEHKIRHHDEALRERERRDRERAEREAARDKERAEALARCQERQRERERIAREKLRREEEEKKYAASGLVGERERLLPRPAEREMAIAAARGYNSRERSLEAVERIPRHASKRELELYECEREFLEAERRGLLDREELRREREYLVARRRELSPVAEHYVGRLRDERDLYAEEERERAYSRAYLDEARHPRERDLWMDPRELRERELREMRDVRELRELEQLRDLYPDQREHIVRERERTLAGRGDWKDDWPSVVERSDWDDGTTRAAGFIGGPVRGGGAAVTTKLPPPREQRAPSEPDWDADETAAPSNLPASSRDGGSSRGAWDEREPVREHTAPREKHSGNRSEHGDRRWPNAEWRDGANDAGTAHTIPAGRSSDLPSTSHHIHREPRGPRGFRRGGMHQEHGERLPGGGSNFRSHAPPPLMTLPVQPPGNSFHGNSANTPRFPNKRNMTYTNPNLIKKQQAALAAAKAAAQASAVAAATTAVAAAKAAAQSAANATTNPGILGQVGSMAMRHQDAVSAAAEAVAEKPEAGEIVGDTDSPNNGSETEDSGFKQIGQSLDYNSSQTMAQKTSGELSEISDSDDDILDKEPTKTTILPASSAIGTNDSAAANSSETASNVAENNKMVTATDDSTVTNEADKQDEEDLLDFEEISDGELEEDARNKGVGDALGVDWASLIAETKRQAANANPQENEQTTTAKQKWQPHRILLDVGISMRMAGEDFAKQLLQDAKLKLAEELGQLKVKSEIKDEVSSTADEDSQAMGSEGGFGDDKKPTLKSTLSNLDDCDVAHLHPLACIQVAERARRLERRGLIPNACGAHSRALSARQDLKLRRQLCGLPARECDLPRPLPAVSSKLKAMALAAFQRTLEVK